LNASKNVGKFLIVTDAGPDAPIAVAANCGYFRSSKEHFDVIGSEFAPLFLPHCQ
jgi:hypothetical protein